MNCGVLDYLRLMKWYWILLIAVGALVALYLLSCLIASYFIARMLYAPKRYSREEQRSYNEKMGYNAGTECLERNDIVFKMIDGYLIHGSYHLVVGSNKYVILAHGHQTTREGALRYALVFESLGFSTIIYDERGHGDNARVNVTMGCKESLDLSEIIRQVYAKFGSSILLGLQGVSMGASTCLLSLKSKEKLAFIVSDCAFYSLVEVVKSQIRHFHLPVYPLISFIDTNLKLFAGFSFADVVPGAALKDNQVPILFIHGESDTYVPPSNAKRLFDMDPGEKKLVYFPNAPHASSITLDKARYISCVESFLKTIKEE